MSKKKQPKILFIDVENSPNQSFTWPGRMYDINIAGFPKGKGKRWQLLSFSWAWNDSPVQYDSKQFDPDDKRIAKRMASLINEADFIVTHNGKRSDLPKINTRLKKHGLEGLKEVQHVDTYPTIKSRYLLDSYSLGNICEYFGLGKKKDAGGIETWDGCNNGDPKAWAKMQKYNPWDVVLLRRLYQFVCKEMPTHPNIHRILNPLDNTAMVCPYCSGRRLHMRGFRATASSIKRDVHCQSCGKRFLVRMPTKAELKVQKKGKR